MAKGVKKYASINQITSAPFEVEVGFERFLGPEIFFNPEIANPDFTTSISDIVDSCIQNCPIDVRRSLYGVSRMLLYFFIRTIYA